MIAKTPEEQRADEVALERAKQAFLAARTPFARRKALRRLEALRDKRGPVPR